MGRFKTTVKKHAKKVLFKMYETGQHLGLDILPRHFYSQVPDLRVLRAETSWKQPRDMRSVHGHLTSSQLQFASAVCSEPFVRHAIDSDIYGQACARNGDAGYGPIEAIFLYAFMRTFKPAQVAQVGCGVSTAVMLAAARDAGYTIRICCIDPFPTRFLREAAAQGEIELLEGRAQGLIARPSSELGDGDLLFVDSTHVVGPGSEVNVVVLDVLPRLAAGAFVHFHDIHFPYDYPRRLLKDELFTHAESTLLHAFLSGNSGFELLAAMSMLHYDAPAELRSLIPAYRPAGNDAGLETGPGHFPSAAYARKRSGMPVQPV